jgi:tRNA G18 (ribose-2'-O)-methylase SpoU
MNEKKNNEIRIIYGRNPVSEALSYGKERVHFVYCADNLDKNGRKIYEKAKAARIPGKFVDKHELFRLCNSTDHQGFVAEATPVQTASLNRLFAEKKTGLRIIMLARIKDPRNLGSILRNCEHFGIDLVIIDGKGSCNPQSSVVAKASAGAIEHQKILVSSRLEKVCEELAEKNFRIYGLDGNAENNLFTTPKIPEENVCIILGSEGEGIPGSLGKKINSLFHIPRFGRVDSLNVSSASVAASLWLSGYIGENNTK